MYRINKYHNTKIKTNAGTFDSKREYNRWLTLKEYENSGEITALERQVKYELIPSQKVAGKVAERAVSYIADFRYKTADGLTVVEDAKGRRTPDYIIKRKLMLYMHGIQVREV